MKLKDKFHYIVEYFEKNMPDAATELHYRTPFQLLVAVILSAQCTDKRVNMITPPLFERYDTAEKLAEADLKDVFKLIASCSYPNNKAKHIIASAKILTEQYNGIIPSDLNNLMSLPGVGRKTANVIASVIFGQQTMPVDTHVKRVSIRIGLSPKAKTPLQVEQQLVKYLPKDKIGTAHHWLILHGRYVCLARNPKCKECGISNICDFYNYGLTS